jgi:hypothetical protein
MSRTGWRNRAGGAALALLVQALFLLLVVLTPAHRTKPVAEKETLLLLPPLAPPPPVTTIDARPPSTLSTAPPIVAPPPQSPPVITAPLAPPGGIAGFGRSLFGCAPENYANLTPEERAHCPRPGEGMAKRNDNDLLNPPRSHAKDEALWQEQYAEDHYVPPICPPSDGPPVGFCVMHQAMAEHQRQQDAWQKIEYQTAARLREPKRPVPNIGVRRGD